MRPLAIAALVVTGCALPSSRPEGAASPRARGTASRPGPTPDRAGVVVALDLPLRFEAGGHPVPVPLVDARLDGAPALLVVDTAATRTAVSRAFAARHHIEVSIGAGDGGAVDERLAVAGVDHVEIGLGGDSRRVTDAIALEEPTPYGALGVVGVLSPQRHFRDGVVVLDLPRRRLMLARGDETAVRAWLARERPGAQVATAKRLGAEDWTTVVAAALDDRGEVRVEIATGAEATTFVAAYVDPSDGGAAADGGEGSPAATGERVHVGGLALGPAPVETGALRGVAGRLGMSHLRPLVVALPLDRAQPILLVRPR